MLEYLGERLFSKTEEYAIFGSVAGWEYEITGTEVKVNLTADKGITLGAIKCSSCERTFIDPEQEMDFCLLSDSDSESVEPQMSCPHCKKVSAMPVYGGHKFLILVVLTLPNFLSTQIYSWWSRMVIQIWIL